MILEILCLIIGFMVGGYISMVHNPLIQSLRDHLALLETHNSELLESNRRFRQSQRVREGRDKKKQEEEELITLVTNLPDEQVVQYAKQLNVDPVVLKGLLPHLAKVLPGVLKSV